MGQVRKRRSRWVHWVPSWLGIEESQGNLSIGGRDVELEKVSERPRQKGGRGMGMDE